jgi:hypothetical protein
LTIDIGKCWKIRWKWSIADVNESKLTNKFHYAFTKSSFTDTAVKTIWVRCRLINRMPVEAKLSMQSGSGRTDFYIIKNNGNTRHFTNGWQYPWSKRDGIRDWSAVPFNLLPNEELIVYMRKHNKITFTVPVDYKIPLYNTEKIVGKTFNNYQDNYIETSQVYLSFFSVFLY